MEFMKLFGLLSTGTNTMRVATKRLLLLRKASASERCTCDERETSEGHKKFIRESLLPTLNTTSPPHLSSVVDVVREITKNTLTL